jgi:hypothetical protein
MRGHLKLHLRKSFSISTTSTVSDDARVYDLPVHDI